MIKVQASKVSEFLDDLAYQLQGMEEYVREGWDSLDEMIISQTATMREQIKVFRLESLTVPEKPAKSKEPHYVSNFERLAAKDAARYDYNKIDFDDSITWGEQMDLFKAKLYFMLKRIIRGEDNSIYLTRNDLNNWLCGVAYDCPYNYLAFDEKVQRSTYRVLDDIAEEIMEHRRKNPQMKLFN